MIKKSLLAMIAVTLFACGNASAQFVNITPSDLVANPTAGQTINGSFQIGQLLGLNANDLIVNVNNAVVANQTNPTLFAVNQSNSTTFTYSGNTAVEAFVQHGQTLGNGFSGGAPAQDGLSSATTFSLDSNVTSLNGNYVFGNSANDYFVEYTGPTNSNNQLQNGTPFRFVSNAPVTSYTVFSTNNDLPIVNNNFATGLRVVSAIPEPSAGIVLVLSGLLALRRKRS